MAKARYSRGNRITRFRWYRSLIAVKRAYDGTRPVLALVGTFNDSYRAANREHATLAQKAINRWVLVNRPLEAWVVRRCQAIDTWGDWELWVEYRGTFESPEAAHAERVKVHSHLVDVGGGSYMPFAQYRRILAQQEASA